MMLKTPECLLQRMALTVNKMDSATGVNSIKKEERK